MVGLNLLFRRKIFHFSSDELWLSAAADMGVCSCRPGYAVGICAVLFDLRMALTVRLI